MGIKDCGRNFGEFYEIHCAGFAVRIWNLWKPFLVFLLAFLSIPVLQLNGLKMMPGDLGDARLNNYFLENIYQYFTGSSDSLWHLGFFWPFPYVIGFSDNLFGSSPVYILGRIVTGQPDTAFQIWFFFGYPSNFIAAFYSLRRLGITHLSSCVGATIFAFALPVSAHAGHAQLHYRFGIPLTIMYFVLFLEKKEWRFFALSGGWLVWQFYCGIYMGFFSLVILVTTLATYLFFEKGGDSIPLIKKLQLFILKWSEQSPQKRIQICLSLVLLLLLMSFLFYPYWQVSNLYDAKRGWSEISSMLPRPQSYILSDRSLFWSYPKASIFSNIPMRHEHQMFIGAVPFLLALTGFLVGRIYKKGQTCSLLGGSIIIMVLITLNIEGFSLWYLFHRLPLFSAIRAMTRFDQVLLFPVAYLCGMAIDHLCIRRKWMEKAIWLIVIPFLIFEFSSTSMATSSKQEWRGRIRDKENLIPKNLPEDAVLFFNHKQNHLYPSSDELDAIWVSLLQGKKTLNGYSGMSPPYFSHHFGNDCSELPKRIISYLSFMEQKNNNAAYRALIKRVVPINFVDCDHHWMISPPPISISYHEYSGDHFRKLGYRFQGIETKDGVRYVKLSIINSNDQTISTFSKVGKPVRLSWRFIDFTDHPVSGWITRKDLPYDIPAQGEITVNIPIDPRLEIRGGKLQITLVQEGVFWAHDIGVGPLTIPWS